MNHQNDQLQQAHQIIIEGLGRSMALYGLPASLGRTYALLYLADTPLSVTEITHRLGITKGTASVNLRLLERLRLLHQVWQRGRRGKFYAAERDYRRALAELMRTTAAAELQTAITALDQAEQLLRQAEASPDAAAREQARADQAKVASLREHYESSYRMLQSFVEAMVADPGEPK